MNSDRALSSYELANRLGLVQSYAYANSQYYYQDGVFYVLENGQYKVIIPPAGALVTSLPDDYDVSDRIYPVLYMLLQSGPDGLPHHADGRQSLPRGPRSAVPLTFHSYTHDGRLRPSIFCFRPVIPGLSRNLFAI